MQFDPVAGKHRPAPYGASQDTTTATLQPGEVGPCNGNTLNTVWFTFRSGYETAATISTQGSDFDTIIALWREDRSGTRRLIGCNDDAATGVDTSQLSFSIFKDTYLIQVGGLPPRPSGNLRLSVSPLIDNDYVGEAEVLRTGYVASSRRSVAFAASGADLFAAETLEPDESRCAGMTSTIWFKIVGWPYAPPQLSVETTGSGFDTVLGVWALDRYTLEHGNIGCNDNNGALITSKLSFSINPRWDYYIQVGGKGPQAAGPVSVIVTPITHVR